MTEMEIPDVVRSKARVAGRLDWIDDLPALVDELATEWRFTTGRAYDGGTEAFVCEVTRAGGSVAVLKVLVPHDRAGAANEATVLQLAGGAACAELFEFDRHRLALLMERLGPSLFDLGVPYERRVPILAETAQRLWRPAADAGLPTGASKARWLGERIVELWEQLDRPCSEQAIEHAVACAHRREAAHDDERAMLVHGDVHQWNVLHDADDRYKLIDPDGLLAEPEYDLGIIMREDPLELMTGDPDERARWLATLTGCDVTAIREWGIVERVSTALLCVELDMQPIGREMLTAAEFVAVG